MERSTFGLSIVLALTLLSTTAALRPTSPSILRQNTPSRTSPSTFQRTAPPSLVAENKPSTTGNVAAGVYSGLATVIDAAAFTSIVFGPVGLPLTIGLQHALAGFVVMQLLVLLASGRLYSRADELRGHALSRASRPSSPPRVLAAHHSSRQFSPAAWSSACLEPFWSLCRRRRRWMRWRSCCHPHCRRASLPRLAGRSISSHSTRSVLASPLVQHALVGERAVMVTRQCPRPRAMACNKEDRLSPTLPWLYRLRHCRRTRGAHHYRDDTRGCTLRRLANGRGCWSTCNTVYTPPYRRHLSVGTSSSQ